MGEGASGLIQFEFFVEKERPTTEIETQTQKGQRERKVKLWENKWRNRNNCGWTWTELWEWSN